MHGKRFLVSLFSGLLVGLALISASRAAQAAGIAPTAQSVARIIAPIDDSQRVALTGQVPRAVRESTDLGDADPKQVAERVTLVLHGSAAQDADLDQFLRDVQTRGRPEYRRWLTPRTFGQRFGVAPADLAVIGTWLRSEGFRIEDEPPGGRSIVFSGTIGQLNAAFSARIHRYRWHGEYHMANSANPTIPKALEGIVVGFASLHDFRRRPQTVGTRIRPQYTSGSTHYLAPGDFAIIYDLVAPYASGITGNGRSLAVIGRSSVVANDIATFRAAFGLSSTLPTVIYANSGNTAPPVVSGDEMESDLDLEWSGAIAPSATIKFVTTASTSLSDGIDLSAQWAVSNNLADVITVSYSGCESPGDVSGGTTFYNQIWQQAAAQGTSVFVSAGDSGAAGCDADGNSTATQGLAVNALCSSPDSTCVGGTEFTGDTSQPSSYWSATNTAGSQASALSYIPESVWNQSGSVSGGSDLYATGGGASIYFAKPAWQLSTGVPSDGLRDVPDLALNSSAAHDGYLIYSSQGESSSTEFVIGGTSCATPSMAGIAALVAQSQQGRVGNFNPVIYGLAGQQALGGATVFHLITSGNNSVPGQTGFSASGADPTYNQATGLGSVNGANLIASWGNYAGPTAGLSPSTVVVPARTFVGNATLSVPSTNSWTASVSSGATGWLSITPANGKGSAPLTYSAVANSSSNSRSGTITVDGQVLTVTQAADTGAAAQVNLSASSIGFGTEPVGEATSGQRLLVSNTGGTSWTLGAISLAGAAAVDFVYSGSCATGLVLVPGAGCYLVITFDPAVTGALAATLQIGVVGGSPVNVALSGTGSSPPAVSDGPIPLWALGALGAGLLGAAARRLRGVA
ncbi:MAG: protease pro-enzyme activation domain-containing protein [Steroidobacteraceae bacterium]